MAQQNRDRSGHTFRFSFESHLARGLYAIEVNVVDLERHRFAALARGIQHFQVVEHVPRGPHDQPVDLLVTDRRVIRAPRGVGVN